MKLAPAIEGRTGLPGSDVRVEMVVQVDQFGILHAPFASARAFLVEYGHGDATVLVHQPK